MARGVLDRLSDETLVAMRCKGDEWPRGLLSETPIPDKWMGLVIRADGRRRFVPAGEDPRPERDDVLMLVRNRPITLPVSVSGAPSSQNHLVSSEVELLVHWPQREDDLAAMYSTLLDGETCKLGRLGEALERAGVVVALRTFIADRSAEVLVNEDVRDALLDHLRAALQRFLFSSGAVLERLGRVHFASEGYSRQAALERSTAERIRSLEARDMVERAALAATRRRLDDLDDVLGKLKDAAAEDGSLQWRDLLPTLTPGERGRLLENLWRLTPDSTKAGEIAVVAGMECVELDPQQPGRIVRQRRVPDDLGGLRSVQFEPGSARLVLGAARGVWVLDADSNAAPCGYAVPGANGVRTGFNAAVCDGTYVFGTHSQLGAWRWRLDAPEEATALLRPEGGAPRTVRAATIDADGRLLIGVDDRVLGFSVEGERVLETAPTGSTIHCLSPLDQHIYVGTSDGRLLRCDSFRPQGWDAVHRAHAAVESICARRWDDLVELVIPAGAQGVTGVYAEEGIISQLLSTPTSIRRAWACDDTLVALNDPRDRLIVLNGSMPARTGVEVPIARMVGHSIQDACIVTM